MPSLFRVISKTVTQKRKQICIETCSNLGLIVMEKKVEDNKYWMFYVILKYNLKSLIDISYFKEFFF